MKKWKIKGSKEFRDLLTQLKQDDRISTGYDGDSNTSFYGIVDKNLDLWDISWNGPSDCEEVTVEELRQLYYPSNISNDFTNAKYIKYIGVKDYYRIPNTVYEVVKRYETNNEIEAVKCNIEIASYSPGSTLYISESPNWIIATEAEYLAQVESTSTTVVKWSVGSYIVITDKPSNTGIIEDLHAVCEILNNSGNCISTKNDALAISREEQGQIKWFATKQEAEDFAKTLTKTTNTEDFKIGDWIVSLTNRDYFCKIGDVFRVVKFGFQPNMIYYTNETWGEASTFRKALLHEIPNNVEVLKQTEKELLAEACKRYPIGTKFKCITHGDIVSPDNYLFHTGDDFTFVTNGNNGFMYRNGKWAEIVEETVKPQFMEREFQVGDRIECVKEYNRISVGMQGVIVEVSFANIGVSWDNFTKGHSCNGKCDAGTGYYIMRNNVRLIGTSSFNTPTSQELNTYGLQVGDALDSDVLNAWTVIEGNRSTDDKAEWHRGGGMFMGNRTIKSFKLIHGHVGFEVSDTGIVYLKAEGFKEFADNYYKQYPVYPQDAYDIIMHQREQLIQEESNQTQKLLTLPTNKIYVRKSKSIK
jgi:hypothetical protein